MIDQLVIPIYKKEGHFINLLRSIRADHRKMYLDKLYEFF